MIAIPASSIHSLAVVCVVSGVVILILAFCWPSPSRRKVKAKRIYLDDVGRNYYVPQFAVSAASCSLCGSIHPIVDLDEHRVCADCYDYMGNYGKQEVPND